MLLCSSTIYDNIEASLFVKLPFSWSSNDKDVSILVKVEKLEHLAINSYTLQMHDITSLLIELQLSSMTLWKR